MFKIFESLFDTRIPFFHSRILDRFKERTFCTAESLLRIKRLIVYEHLLEYNISSKSDWKVNNFLSLKNVNPRSRE